MENFTWYVAGPWDHKDAVYEDIKKIRAAGWGTCSRWAEPDNPDVDPADPERDEKLRFQAIRDVEDVVKADGLIYINSKKSDGKATELGIALAMLKPIVAVGAKEHNIFLHLNIPIFPTIEEALEWLKGEGASYLLWVEAKAFAHMQRTVDIFSEVMDDEIFDTEGVEFPSE